MSKGGLRWFAAGLLSATLVASGFGAAAHATEVVEASGYATSACNSVFGGVWFTRLGDVSPLQPAESAKSLAILGGQPSALEQMRLAQEAAAPATVTADANAAMTQLSLSPAAGGVRPDPAACESTIGLAPALIRPERKAGDFLASKRLTIGHTAFDRDWRRVSADRVSAARYQQLLGGVPSDRFSALRSVNGWVNQRIAYTEDRELFAKADFWAGAKRTLKLGRGDCEDIALTKMQLLAAAGVPREDMVLTIARDLVRNADHAVLIVRLDGQYYLLDNATDDVLDASDSYDYRPVLSFGERQTWLHGY